MKRRAEYLVSKRDGRKEWLRATKLARSIHMAMSASGASETWRSIDIASTVLMGLRSKLGSRAPLSSAQIALASQQVLAALGFVGAADLYSRVGARQRRRQRLLRDLMRDRPGESTILPQRPAKESGPCSFPMDNRFSHN